jgi:hypothetical protein
MDFEIKISVYVYELDIKLKKMNSKRNKRERKI